MTSPDRISDHADRRGPNPSRPSPPRLIGVAVDGHPSARDAVILGSLLARSIAAELMLITVYEEPILAVAVPAEMGWSSLQEQAWSMALQTREALAPGARIVVQPDVLVWRGVRSVARREHRDLLVVGSGRRATDGHVGLGETVAELIDHLDTPLAIAPRGMRERDKPALARIGVGFEDGPEARAALELAGAIALAAGARLAVHAVIDDRTPTGVQNEQLVPVGETIVENQARSLRAQAHEAARATGVPVRVEVSAGKPADALCAFGARVDLLVIGSSRSGPPGRTSVGSSAGDVAERCTSPLLLVPRPRPPDASQF